MRARRTPPQGREPLSTSGSFSVAALLSTVAVKLLLEVKKRSKFSSPTENDKENPTTQTNRGKGELK